MRLAILPHMSRQPTNPAVKQVGDGEQWDVPVLGPTVWLAIPRDPDSAAAPLLGCPGQGLPLRSRGPLPCQLPWDPYHLHWAGVSFIASRKYTCHCFNCGRRLPLWQGRENLVEECLVVWGCYIFSAL